MALIFTQKVGRETRIIDCASEVGVGIDWMAGQLNDRAAKRGFVYGNPAVLMPHDAGHPQASNAGAASFAQKFKQDYGFSCRVNPVTASVAWSIDQAKHFMRTCVFDKAHAANLLTALRHYHRKWDLNRRTYSDQPVHDWSSNFADSFRTGSEAKPRLAAGQSYRQRVPYAASGLYQDPGQFAQVGSGLAVDYEDPLGRS